jgi:hypothetical protein
MKQLFASNATSVAAAEWSAEAIPLVVFPGRRQSEIAERAASLRAVAERYLPRFGSMLFRGFQAHRDQDFARFVRTFGASIDVLPAGSIWGEAGSGRMWIACASAVDAGAETLIADNRELLANLSSGLRSRLAQRGLRFARDAGPVVRAVYADGSALEASVLAKIAAAFVEAASPVAWEPGDVLLVDRALTTLRIPAGQRRHLRFASDRITALSRVS